MNFAEAESYLLSLGNEVETMKLGLENITILLAALCDPQNKYRKVQVAGTNGKGSVCAFLDSICREANIRTGLYTSPHLVSITERIKIDGADISEDEFARLANRVREIAETLVAEGKLTYRPTFFEQITAIALLAFAEHDVELAILETGLGGRYDATTASKAEIAAIARIDLDHQEYLGDTIKEIAAEKAAVIEAGTETAVIGNQVHPDALETILRRCHEVSVDPILVSDKGGDVSGIEADLKSVKMPENLALLGKHQRENARIAVATAKVLQKHFRISESDIRRGLETARHPGRLEYIDRFLLDGAHNPAGAHALRAYLDEFINGPITLIFGAMRDKAIAEIASILWPRVETLILTRPSNSRALTAGEILKVTPLNIDTGEIVITDSVKEAIEKAVAISPPEGLIVVTGSLYLVGEVKKLLNN